MIRSLTFGFVALLLALVVSCDAPRVNPLDPENPDYNFGQLDGYVYSTPRSPAGAVKILWKNQNIVTETDATGYYKIEGIQRVDGKIYYEKTGMTKDSAFVTWGSSKSIRVDEKTLGFSSGVLEGTVWTVALPRKVIPGVNVLWKNKNTFTQTDASGKYSFKNLQYEKGYLVFEKPGYSKDSLYVEFDNNSSKTAPDQFLNAIPNLTTLKLFTTVENRYDYQRIRLEVRAAISDDEGDIDSVFIKSTSLNFSRALFYNPTTRFYENSFVQTDLNLLALDEAIGKNFDVVVKDKLGKTFNIGSSNIKRIIKDVISVKNPANGVTTSSKPKLEWNRFQPGFSFTYALQIYSDEISPILIWSKENILSDAIEYSLETAIPAGNYFWVISCVDEFGDLSRSRPATFVITQ